MKELLKVLTQIRNSIGGDLVEVLATTNEFGGVEIRVHWYDGSNFSVRYGLTQIEIENIVDDSIIVAEFIKWANEAKKLSTENDEISGRKGAINYGTTKRM